MIFDFVVQSENFMNFRDFKYEHVLCSLIRGQLEMNILILIDELFNKLEIDVCILKGVKVRKRQICFTSPCLLCFYFCLK